MHAGHLDRLLAGACRISLAGSVLLILAACQQGKDVSAAQGGVTELAWARVALERNPKIEVVATDVQTGVFTIRDKSTGEVRAVRLSELAAVPIAQLTEPPAVGPSPAGRATSATSTSSADAKGEDLAAAQTGQTTEGADTDDAAATTASPSSESVNYTIERADGQVKVSGPGVSIVSSESSAGAAPRRMPGQRTVDPIICEGRQMVHLDNRNIYVEGDAITARGGCELHITNSHIVASGVGLVVRGAVAHVSNSHIEGATGSYDADGSAKLYVRGSTINGVPRRHAYAQIQDQGGNQWRQTQAASSDQ